MYRTLYAKLNAQKVLSFQVQRI